MFYPNLIHPSLLALQTAIQAQKEMFAPAPTQEGRLQDEVHQLKKTMEVLQNQLKAKTHATRDMRVNSPQPMAVTAQLVTRRDPAL